MKISYVFFFVLVSSLIAVFEVADARDRSSLSAAATLGSGLMLEAANDGNSKITRLPYAVGVGARLARWMARFEYGAFRTVDGNATIATTRELENAIGWLGYDLSDKVTDSSSWTPYLALGLGLSRSTSETRLQQSSETTRGNWSGMAALALGFRSEWTSIFHVRPELRYETAESFKTKDARMGAFFQVDLVF